MPAHTTTSLGTPTRVQLRCSLLTPQVCHSGTIPSQMAHQCSKERVATSLAERSPRRASIYCQSCSTTTLTPRPSRMQRSRSLTLLYPTFAKTPKFHAQSREVQLKKL